MTNADHDHGPAVFCWLVPTEVDQLNYYAILVNVSLDRNP